MMRGRFSIQSNAPVSPFDCLSEGIDKQNTFGKLAMCGLLFVELFGGRIVPVCFVFSMELFGCSFVRYFEGDLVMFTESQTTR